MMNYNQIVESLRTEAKSNKVADCVFTVFTDRKRTRNVLTVNGLYQRMKAKNFDFSMHEYGEVLKFLSSLGLGTLELSKKGRVRALKDIKFTLQSIGQNALNGENGFEVASRKTHYSKMPMKALQERVIKSVKALAEEPIIQALSHKEITIAISGKDWKVSVPSNADEKELVKLINALIK